MVGLDRFFPSFLSKIHEERGNFCIFLLKIAEKEGKTDLKSDVEVERDLQIMLRDDPHCLLRVDVIAVVLELTHDLTILCQS